MLGNGNKIRFRKESGRASWQPYGWLAVSLLGLVCMVALIKIATSEGEESSEEVETASTAITDTLEQSVKAPTKKVRPAIVQLENGDYHLDHNYFLADNSGREVEDWEELLELMASWAFENSLTVQEDYNSPEAVAAAIEALNPFSRSSIRKELRGQTSAKILPASESQWASKRRWLKPPVYIHKRDNPQPATAPRYKGVPARQGGAQNRSKGNLDTTIPIPRETEQEGGKQAPSTNVLPAVKSTSYSR